VLAGGHGDGGPALARLAAGLGVADRVIFPGRVEDQDLPALYSGAALYALPSLEEGFGATVLEAMACGAPVVASNRAALPEVVADAGLLCDAEQELELAAMLARVLSDAGLAEELRRRALARARPFTPERTSGRALAAPGDHRSRDGPAAHERPHRTLLDRLQRRDLQLPPAARRAGGRRASVPDAQRHRGHPPRVRRVRRGVRRAPLRHVRLRHLGRRGTSAVPCSRPAGEEAALLLAPWPPVPLRLGAQ